MKQQFLALKEHNTQGASDSKYFWIYAAKKIGMEDTAESGIQITDESKAQGKLMLPYGVENQQVVDQIAQATASQTTPLVSEEDRATCSPFVFESPPRAH